MFYIFFYSKIAVFNEPHLGFIAILNLLLYPLYDFAYYYFFQSFLDRSDICLFALSIVYLVQSSQSLFHCTNNFLG